jgi:hypothetical protein
MITRNLPGVNARPERNNLTAIFKPSIQKIWEPRPPWPVTGYIAVLQILTLFKF